MNALDIPEIRASIGLHLDNASLIACVLVCRAWQASFEPYIWSDLLISSEESSSHQRPCLQGLRRNAHLATHLALAGCNPLEFLVLGSTADEESQRQSQQLPEPAPGSIQPRPPPLLPSPLPPAPPQQRSHGFCNLLRLVVSNSRNDTPPKGYWEAIATIISQNPRLNHLRISSLRPPASVLWQAICSLRAPLQALHLFRLTVPPEHAHLLWDAFSKADSVRFIHTSLPPLPQELSLQQQQKGFSRLQRLFILEEQSLSSTALVDLISHCPNLRELQWNTNVGVGFPTELFLERLQTQPALWPRLRQLRIPHETLVEEQLCRILEATTDLESFSALYHHRHDTPPPHPHYFSHMTHETTLVQPEAYYADKSTTRIRILPALARHFHTLRELTFSAPKCDKTSSIIMQTVLSSCPSLVSISGEVIRGVEIATGAPWVCLGLQNFYLDVDVAPHAVGISTETKGSSGPPNAGAADSETTPQPSSLASIPTPSSSTPSRTEIQKRVLHQLARLQRLQNLTLMSHHYSPSFSPVSKSHRRGLELDLRHGLDLLGGMTQLCNVYFSTIQNMDLEDAFWIAQHWKRLSSLTNRLHPDPILNQGLWEVCLRRRKDVVRLGLGLGMGGSIET